MTDIRQKQRIVMDKDLTQFISHEKFSSPCERTSLMILKTAESKVNKESMQGSPKPDEKDA